MNYKKKIYGILFVSTAVILVSLVLSSPDNFSLCEKSDISCIDSYYNYIYRFNNIFPDYPTVDIVKILFFFSVPITILSLLLLFFQEKVFRAWLKFAIIFLPIAVTLVILMTRGSYGTFIWINEKMSSLFFAAIFLIVSLFIIIIKSLKLRGEGK